MNFSSYAYVPYKAYALTSLEIRTTLTLFLVTDPQQGIIASAPANLVRKQTSKRTNETLETREKKRKGLALFSYRRDKIQRVCPTLGAKTLAQSRPPLNRIRK